ncbi:MAG: hypothetical protein O3A00_27660 [Planctomycetota bacterium]|nr:hypothetical protein [Planctomycetota bacterium]
MIEFKLSRYRSFISEFRQSLGVGVPENRDGDLVEAHCAPNSYRFNVADLYMTHIKGDSQTDWRKITRHNYSQMGITDSFTISGGKIVGAFGVEQPSGTDLALVVLATSEAARSQVVYQIIQQMLHDPSRTLTWAQIKPMLIGSWIFNIKENHKTRPIKYGALGSRDYYNEKAVNSIQQIRQSRFHLD